MIKNFLKGVALGLITVIIYTLILCISNNDLNDISYILFVVSYFSAIEILRIRNELSSYEFKINQLFNICKLQQEEIIALNKEGDEDNVSNLKS